MYHTPPNPLQYPKNYRRFTFLMVFHPLLWGCPASSGLGMVRVRVRIRVLGLGLGLVVLVGRCSAAIC